MSRRDPAAAAEYQRQYHQEHRAQRNESTRRWHAANRGKVNEGKRRRYKQNPQQGQAAAMIRRHGRDIHQDVLLIFAFSATSAAWARGCPPRYRTAGSLRPQPPQEAARDPVARPMEPCRSAQPPQSRAHPRAVRSRRRHRADGVLLRLGQRRRNPVTVYVDDWRQQARVGRVSARWSHLMAGPEDDIAELHELAQRIGLQRRWFQDKPWPRAHYDVTESKRAEAIAAGAVPITWREGGRMRTDAIERRRSAATPGGTP